MPHSLIVERRITLRLLAYWEKLRGDGAMPGEGDINSDDIPDLWDSCFLVHVEDLGKPDYNYTYLGQDIAAAFHAGLPAGAPETRSMPNASAITHSYNRVIETRKPLLEEGEFINLRGETVRYRQCLLPLGEGGRVVAIFGGMRFKTFRP